MIHFDTPKELFADMKLTTVKAQLKEKERLLEQRDSETGKLQNANKASSRKREYILRFLTELMSACQ